jgi:Protein-L-isoaspartate(D-aspartate) O-methyltransferase (PCMT)
MVVFIEGDGRLGLEEFQPYDVIHVGAGSFNINRGINFCLIFNYYKSKLSID